MEEEIKRGPGPRRCKVCGEVLPKSQNSFRSSLCLACLRAETEAPPYPCTDCKHKDNLSCKRSLGLKACEAWTDWAMITWRLTTEALKERCGGKK